MLPVESEEGWASLYQRPSNTHSNLLTEKDPYMMDNMDLMFDHKASSLYMNGDLNSQQVSSMRAGYTVSRISYSDCGMPSSNS